MKFSTGLILLTSVLGAFANTPAQVIADMSSISDCATKLSNDVKAMTNWDLPGAWAIHTAARTLVTTLDLATSNAKIAIMNLISPDDVQAALTATNNLGQIIVKTMEDLMDMKDVIKNLPVAGAMTLAFEDAMLAGVPNDMKGVVNGIIGTINDAFAAAMSVYS
ncbi:hypothetical protein BJ165DRAFT_1607323 [Panaeolus papilionaceus]|nr:hypothetical protein BJ165DRAFT_1607323 [Panaeolus papilionaceus]